ncbi:flagellin [Clostridium niameyense]|uniref:flagellin N-terminal helical domain-containing protein n=1 Tax=Clostridium niameyense TaxID=1622073 RepID=UPI00067E740A|nr:flagellin [Clostridium niameyense]
MLINNVNVLNSFNKIVKNKKKTEGLIEKVSSGKRINRAADDASGLCISESFKAQVRGLSQAQRNTQDGISLLQTVEGALDDISQHLYKMKELAVKAANDTLTDKDRKLADEEFQNLKNSIEDISDKTEFNKIKLLKENKSLNIQIKDSPFTTYTINLKSLTSKDIGIDGSCIDTLENASNSIEHVNNAINKVIEYRVNVGTDYNNLCHTYNDSSNAEENITSALSRIEDEDMALSIMGIVKGNVLIEYNKSMVIGARQSTESVSTLLSKGIS